MTIVLTMLAIQSLLGAFDNLWHHEITEALPSNPAARLELTLHTIREFLYAVIFYGIGWYEWRGMWACGLVAVLAIEICVTLCDFVVEDKTRKLPGFERVLHTVLAINFGAILSVWAPILLLWADTPSRIVPVSYGLWSWVFSIFAVGVFGWAIRDLYAVVRLGVPMWQSHPMKAVKRADPRTILITGATGFIGRHLVRALIESGDRVVVLTRNPVKGAWIFGPLVEILGDLAQIDRARRIDAVVNLAGEPLAGGLWTQTRKRKFFSSRLRATNAVIDLIRRLDRKPSVLVNASAIGFYGDRQDEVLTEQSCPSPHLLSDICQQWEAAAERAAEMNVRVCRIRIGFVLGTDGGALPALARPANFGLGAIMGDGKQWMSWIHIEDLIALLRFAIEREDLSGAVNAVAPEAVTHESFMRTLGRSLGRPVFLRIPAKALRLTVGEFSELFLAGQRVVPAAAVAASFRFKYAHLADAMGALVGNGAESAGSANRVTSFFNDACPVCSLEIEHYAKTVQTTGAPIDFMPICSSPSALADYGLTPRDVQRRLFTIDEQGQLQGGVDAFLPVWRQLPLYRRLAALVSQPGLYQIAFLLYEGIFAPILDWWNRRRPENIADRDSMRHRIAP